MSVDELIDDPDMDRALRALQPQIVRSRSWEKARRSELLAFIETGQVSQREPLRRFQLDDVAVAGSTGRRGETRRLIWLASAAAVALLVAALMVVPWWRGSEPSEPGGFDQPTEPSVVDQPGTTLVPSPQVIDLSLRPEFFPAFAVGDPRNDNAIGSYRQVGYENPLRLEALVARSDGDAFVDAVGIMVWADIGDVDVSALGTHATQTLTNGSTVDVYTEPGTPPTITVMLPNDPVAVTGTDPLPFVDAIEDFSVLDPAAGRGDDASRVVDFSLTELGSLEPLHVFVPLPPGYVMVVEPHPLERGSLHASLRAGNEAANDFLTVEVGLSSPLNGWSVIGPLRSIDVNGTTAWVQDQTNVNAVSWRLGERTWVTVSGAPTIDAAIEAARNVEFVDEATWQERYGVAEPTFAAPPGGDLDYTAPNPPASDTNALFTPPARSVRVMVANASEVDGAASALSAALDPLYETRQPVSTAESVGQLARTIVYYQPGFEPDAATLAEDLGGADVLAAPAVLPIEAAATGGDELIDVLVMLGDDHARRTWTGQ